MSAEAWRWINKSRKSRDSGGKKNQAAFLLFIRAVDVWSRHRHRFVFQSCLEPWPRAGPGWMWCCTHKWKAASALESLQTKQMGCREAGGFVIAIWKMGEAGGKVRDNHAGNVVCSQDSAWGPAAHPFPTGFSRGGGVSGEGCPSQTGRLQKCLCHPLVFPNSAKFLLANP